MYPTYYVLWDRKGGRAHLWVHLRAQLMLALDQVPLQRSGQKLRVDLLCRY